MARISFANEKVNWLGIRLPGGVARLYGGGLLLGEDHRRHLSEGERARLVMGHALEVTARPKGKSIALVARQGQLFGSFDFCRFAVDQGVRLVLYHLESRQLVRQRFSVGAHPEFF